MFFVVADLHASQSRMLRAEMKCQKYLGRNLSSEDVFIACGDTLGSRSTRDSKKKKTADKDFVRLVSNSPYAVYSVFGNHDRATKILEKDGYGSTIEEGQPVIKMADNFSFLLNAYSYHLTSGDDELNLLCLGEASGHFQYKGKHPQST